jgi:hypothetical protein
MKRIALAIAVVVASLPASPAVLYKSVDEKGVIQFSDLPPAPGLDAKRLMVPESSSAVPGVVRSPDVVASGPTAEERIRANDTAVQNASLQVDLAEHALAVARRPMWEIADPMKLAGPRMTRGDRDRIDFSRRNLKVAQQQLADVLRQKRKLETATMTAEAGMPIYGPSSPIYRR